MNTKLQRNSSNEQETPRNALSCKKLPNVMNVAKLAINSSNEH